MRAAVILCVWLGCVESPEIGEVSDDLVHLKGGPHAAPTFTDEGTQLRVTGGFTGLGNQDATLVLETSGVATAGCFVGGFQFDLPTGVYSGVVTSSISMSVSSSEIKNGWYAFDVETPPFVGCISDVTFQSATITLWQGGAVTFQQSFRL